MIKKLIYLFLFVIFAIGCLNKDIPNPNDPIKFIDDAKKNNTSSKNTLEEVRGGLEKQSISVKDSSKKIIEFSGNINNYSTLLENDFFNDKLTKSTFTLNLKGIKDNNNLNIEEAKKLEIVSEELNSYKIKTEALLKSNQDLSLRLKGAGDSVGQLSKRNEKLSKELIELKANNRQLLNWALTGMIVIGILAIVGAGLVFFLSQGANSRFALILGGSGLCTMIISAAVMTYFQYLALVGLISGGIGVIAIFGSIIHQVWVNKKSADKLKEEVNVSNTALKETVTTVEAIKDLIPENTKKDFFGEGAVPGKVSSIQSDSTVNKVLDIRQAMKKHWEPTVVKK
jgi:hypothetical protein